MQLLRKQAVGIDCANQTFLASFGTITNDGTTTIVSSREFKNTPAGFQLLLRWVKKLTAPTVPLHIVMEATGVYHERLLYWLSDAAQAVSVILPQRAKHFAKTLTIKTVTDTQASKTLTIMALEKQLETWKKPEPIFRQLRQLTREREQLQKHRTQVLNQLHAEGREAYPLKQTILRLEQHERFLTQQITKVDNAIEKLINSHPDLSQKIRRIASIPGVGMQTVATIVAETNGFAQTRNKRQLVSFAGYDIVEKQSGTSVHGKAHISHQGNRHIRKALHMPALSAIRHSASSKELFQRLVSKHGIKMKGVVAVQRKLLVLIYTLWKNDTSYDPTIAVQNKQREQPGRVALIELDHVRSQQHDDVANPKIPEKVLV